MTPNAHPHQDVAVYGVVPYLHVADVDRSVAFYARLGFTADMVLRPPHREAPAFWASVVCGTAQIFFARASGPIDPTQQAVLLYLYSHDVRGLRSHLLSAGLTDGGAFGPAQKVTWSAAGVAYEVTSPNHMPAGELRIHDPDGYCLLIGQRD